MPGLSEIAVPTIAVVAAALGVEGASLIEPQALGAIVVRVAQSATALGVQRACLEVV
jgi:hypothetical protein